MWSFDWGFGILVSAIAAIGLGFLVTAYRFTRRLRAAGSNAIVAGPLWLIGCALVLAAVAAVLWAMFGPILGWVILSFF